MVEATIEDLSITIRSSGESDGGRRCCIEHDFVKEFKMWASTGTKPFLKAEIMPSGITEIGMLP